MAHTRMEDTLRASLALPASDRFFATLSLAYEASLARSVSKGLAHRAANALQALRFASRQGAAGESSRPAAAQASDPRVARALEDTGAMLEGIAGILGRMAALDERPEDGPAETGRILAELVEWQRCQLALPPMPVRTDFEASLPPVRVPSADALLALMAVLTNAKEAVAGAGGGEVRIQAAAVAPRVTISVEDDGPGIAPAALPEIFTPFYTTKDPARHLGIGLTVARHLIERAGGAVRAEARQPGGRVIVELPA